MQKFLAVAIGLSMLSLLIPGAVAGETVNSEYFTTAGVRVLGFGLGSSWRPCPDDGDGGCDLNDPYVCPVTDTCTPPIPTFGLATIPDIIKMGGGPLIAAGSYDSVIVRVNDDVFGTSAATSACFFNPDGDNICQSGTDTLDGVEDVRSGLTCGSVSVVGAPFLSNRVTVFVYTLVVLDDLTTCGGVAGTMHGDFFMA